MLLDLSRGSGCNPSVSGIAVSMPKCPFASLTVKTRLGSLNQSAVGCWQRGTASQATRFGRPNLGLAFRTHRLLLAIHDGLGTEQTQPWVHKVHKRSVPSIRELELDRPKRDQNGTLLHFLFLSQHGFLTTGIQFYADTADLSVASSCGAMFAAVKNDLEMQRIPCRFIE